MGLLNTFSSKISRKKFLARNMLLIGGITFFNRWIPKEGSPITARFLTKDGKLVEVDVSKLPAERKTVSNQQLVRWIWKNNKL